MYNTNTRTDMNSPTRNSNQVAYDANSAVTGASYGRDASRSLYSVHGNFLGTQMKGRELLKSRLWHGVPQLSEDQIAMFEAAYTGHTFIFVVDMPAFMTRGIYENTNMHFMARNIKAIIERASTGFQASNDIQVGSAAQEDGFDNKITHITQVTKAQEPVTLTLHEFAGLPVKNGLEAWVTGIYDIKSQHGNYHGNLGIPGGWCLANHTMSILVVQVSPDWQVIQDAAYYYNMVPQQIDFSTFNYSKGQSGIYEDASIQFFANEERSPAVTFAAERYMNNRVLSMVETSVYNSRRFVINPFGADADYSSVGFNNNLENIIDDNMYGASISNDRAKANNPYPKSTTVSDNYVSIE